MSYQTKKSLGQHFLHSPGIIDKIAGNHRQDPARHCAAAGRSPD